MKRLYTNCPTLRRSKLTPRDCIWKSQQTHLINFSMPTHYKLTLMLLLSPRPKRRGLVSYRYYPANTQKVWTQNKMNQKTSTNTWPTIGSFFPKQWIRSSAGIRTSMIGYRPYCWITSDGCCLILSVRKAAVRLKNACLLEFCATHLENTSSCLISRKT